jgi:hypothetical protein
MTAYKEESGLRVDDHHGMAEWDRGDDIGVTIIETVARIEGVDPVTLPPLQPQVDVTSLSTLFVTEDDTNDHTCYVRFEYAGYVVAVHAGGLLEVTETSS